MMTSETDQKRQPSIRVQQKRARARGEILQAAQDILLTGGADAVTLASVAGTLNMTKQAIYHYFPSKEALSRSLVTALLNHEVVVLVDAVNVSASRQQTLGIMIRAFYDHYINRLEAFRAVYCQTQLFSAPDLGEINPKTRHLFDVLEEAISDESMSQHKREEMRQLAFSAWTGALGLMTMLSIADSATDPLIHTDDALLNTLVRVFDSAVRA
jgi:AcrR family transcriptional regulator